MTASAHTAGRATTVDGLLARAARQDPSRAALVLPRGRDGEQVVSFGEFDRRVSDTAAGLQAHGVQPGQRAAVLIPPTADFFVVIIALLRLGAVPVLVDPGIGRQHLRTCLGEAEPDAFIGVRKAHLARRLLRWCPSARLTVAVGPGPHAGASLAAVERDGAAARSEGWAPLPRDPDLTAAIVFTSGSTGTPKGVEQTQAGLLAQTRLIASLYGLDARSVSLATFPPFALFGAPLGMTTVIPRMDPTRPADASPQRVIAAANRRRATVMFGSPALLDTLVRGAGTASMPTVRQVISAGAPVSRSVQRGVLGLLGAGALVHSPYGATEGLPVTSIDSAELLRLPAGICVGRPVPGVDVALIRVTDDPVAELAPDLLVAPGEVGEVVVRGPNISRAYLGRPEATAAAKLRWDGQPAHRMGDLAWADAEGRLWFAGRKSHRVPTAAGVLYSVPVEELVNTVEGVRRSALVGVPAPGAATLEPVVVVELEPGRRQRPTAEVLAVLGADPALAQIRRVLYHRGFPVDIRHNAKIDRPALARWAASR